MKNSIKLTALLLLFGTGLFAAVPAKHADPKTTSIKSMVRFSLMPSKRGIEIKVKNDAPGKAMVIIYDWNNDVVWKDALTQKKGMDKAFNLSQLDNGNYTIEVMLDKQVVEKTAHVYYRGDTKFVQIRG
jgi:Rieske Fe-S protein